MRRRLRLLFALCIALSWSVHVRADDAQVIHPWRALGDGFIGSYTWPNVLYHASAVALTPPIVYALDEPAQRYFQQHNPLGPTFAQATLAFGWVSPIIIPAGLYLGGLGAGASEIATAGAAALQAVVVQAVIVTALKWLTDRKGPYPNGDPAQARWSEGLFRDSTSAKDFNFNPFDVTGGLRWPSGHTASNIALVSALVAFYPDEPWLAALGYPVVLAIALGMIEGDYHWLSDIVAGALMGHAIGWVIGKRFRRLYEESKSGKQQQQLELLPSAAPLGLGMQLRFDL